MVTDDRSRGQLILIGAIALAFIILGIVVVFNGVVYTETLSSGSTSQSATSAEVTAHEVGQGVGCLLWNLNDDNEYDNSDREAIREEINMFGEAYRETNAQSRPVVRDVNVDDDSDIAIDSSAEEIEHATVTIAYDSQDLSYEQTRVIDPDDCNS